MLDVYDMKCLAQFTIWCTIIYEYCWVKALEILVQKCPMAVW